MRMLTVVFAGLAVAAAAMVAGCEHRQKVVYEREPSVHQEEVIVVREAPPPPRREVIITSPGPDYVWVDGYYSWNNRYVWVPGRYVRPPDRSMRWVPDRWNESHDGWHHEPGRWEKGEERRGDSGGREGAKH